MTRDAIKTIEVGQYTVSAVQDSDPMSPLEWDNLGTMVCWHRRYELGDKHNFDSPSDFQESDEYKNAAIVLPLYLYDHSGISISCASFSCPWDSGQVGYIYISKEKIRKEYSAKRVSKKLLACVSTYLQNEVKTYDAFLTGAVYGFVVEDSNGEHIGSCHGFFDIKECLAEGKLMAEHQIKEDAKIDRMLPDTIEVSL